jgi:hypothetical protein
VRNISSPGAARASGCKPYAAPARCDEEIALSVGAGGSTVYRTKRRFVEGNLEGALSEERKLSGKEEALLVATACSIPPKGRARAGRWSCWPTRG